MEPAIKLVLLSTLISAAIMWPCFQWYMWRERAVSASNAARVLEHQVNSMGFQQEPMEKERKLHHETMQQAFDFINDNGPWGANDVGMMKVRKALMDALSTSTVGRT